jgi:hypothetical protein
VDQKHAADDVAGNGSERLCFVDQHDGDPVFHRVDETAGVANQRFG